MSKPIEQSDTALLLRESSGSESILQVCFDVRNAILNDVKQLVEVNAIREYLRPVRGDEGWIYRRVALTGSAAEAEFPHERRLAAHLLPFARALWRIWREKPDCENAECTRTFGPWITFVIVDQTHVRPHRSGAATPSYYFHSFGITGGEPDDWYDFLDTQQQEQAAESTFILSSLFYSDWFPPNAPPVLSFRIWFSPRPVRVQIRQREVIELVIEAPDEQPWPLRLLCDQRYSYTKRKYNKWKKEIERAKGAGNLYEGVRNYARTIGRFMGAEDSEWVLHGFPVPAFGAREPSSGFYMATDRLCAGCAARLRELSFLVSSVLWPLDHLWRQRSIHRNTEELEDWRLHFRRIVRYTSAVQRRIRSQLEAVVRSDRSDHARFRDFVATLSHLQCEMPRQRLVEELQGLCVRLGFDRKTTDAILKGVIAQAEYLTEKTGQTGLKHLLLDAEGDRLAHALATAIETICSRILTLWSFDREVRAFASELAGAFGRVARDGRVWPISIVWKLSDGIQGPDAEICLREFLDRTSAFEIRVTEVSDLARGWELPVVGFLIDALFQKGRADRLPIGDPPVVTVCRTADEWNVAWQSDSGSRIHRDFLRESGRSLSEQGHDLPTNTDHLRERAGFISDLLGLVRRGGAISLQHESDGTACLRICFGEAGSIW